MNPPERQQEEAMSVTEKTFVITGAATGIGRAVAVMAASRGARVFLSDVDDTAGEAAAAAIVDAGGSAAYAHCDVSDAEQVQALMAQAAQTFGGIDVVHNNAGIHEGMITKDFTFETMPVEVFDRVLAVNLRGAFLCSQAALPYLKQSTRMPSIINAGSTASFAGYPYGLAYGTSKGGISLFTKNLAVALAPYGIRANCYCPASVDTNMVRDVSASIAANAPVSAASDPNPNAAQLGAHLVRRIGHPDDVAELVCFLASDAAGFVNGVSWLIDGGTLAWRDTVEALGMT
jgi:NAD(P)-dependent dehydrogenase (short-subunit alcohol dehydrogenase family)